MGLEVLTAKRKASLAQPEAPASAVLDESLPGFNALRELTRKARSEEPFSVFEYRYLASVLAFVETDSMYWFKRGGKDS